MILDGNTLKGPPTLGRVQTEQELLEVAGLDPNEWSVDKLSINIKDGEVSQTWGKVSRVGLPSHSWSKLERKVLKEIKKSSPRVKKPRMKRTKRVLELRLPDVHLGKLAWLPETGSNYDLKIAARDFKASVCELLNEVEHLTPFDYVITAIGNDYFHIDSILDGKIPITARGTAQDVDGRWQKSFDLGYDLMVWLLETLFQYAPEVRGKVIPGNHDYTKAYVLGKLLEARYHNDARFSIDNRPVPRKYHHYGVNLIGWTHGDKEKALQLRGLMSKESGEAWHLSRYKEFVLGHLHKKEHWTDEESGVNFSRSRSISGDDNWHFQSGFTGIRGAEGVVWDKEKGPRLRVDHVLLPTDEEIAALAPPLSI